MTNFLPLNILKIWLDHLTSFLEESKLNEKTAASKESDSQIASANLLSITKEAIIKMRDAKNKIAPITEYIFISFHCDGSMNMDMIAGSIDFLS